MNNTRVFLAIIAVFLLMLVLAGYSSYKVKSANAIVYSVITSGIKNRGLYFYGDGRSELFHDMYIDPYTGRRENFSYKVLRKGGALIFEIVKGPYYVVRLQLVVEKNPSNDRFFCSGGSFMDEFHLSMCRTNEGGF